MNRPETEDGSYVSARNRKLLTGLGLKPGENEYAEPALNPCQTTAYAFFTGDYLAHFLGVQGASRFIALLSDKPDESVRKAFPRAAKANRALFFAKDAIRKPKALTVAEVHGRIDAMIDKRIARYASIRQDLAPALTVVLLSRQDSAASLTDLP